MRKWYAAAMAALGLAVTGAAGAGKGDTVRGCERSFDAAVADFDAVFLAKDLPKVMPYYHDEAVQIGSNGAYRKDKAAIQANFTGLFTYAFTATFPEVNKVVDGCRGATLVVDFTLTIPSVGFNSTSTTRSPSSASTPVEDHPGCQLAAAGGLSTGAAATADRSPVGGGGSGS